MDNLGIFNSDSYLFLKNDNQVEPQLEDALKQNVEYGVVNDIFDKIDPVVNSQEPKYDVDKIVDMVQERFRIRRTPHSIDRLKKVLNEDQFKEYYSEYLFDDVLKKLESNHRVFEKQKKSPKRNNRKRGR
jgi:hypothetical protein